MPETKIFFSSKSEFVLFLNCLPKNVNLYMPTKKQSLSILSPSLLKNKQVACSKNVRKNYGRRTIFMGHHGILSTCVLWMLMGKRIWGSTTTIHCRQYGKMPCIF